MMRRLSFAGYLPNPAERYSIDRRGEPQRAAAAAARHVENLRSYLVSKPPAEHTKDAVYRALEWKSSTEAEHSFTVLDAGCGTGRSSARLAETFGTHCRVLGVDRSLTRLEKGPHIESLENVLLLRAELADFWRLSLSEAWYFNETQILYPNPVPCSNGLKRRLHGQPFFPLALAAVADEGGILVRSNWEGFIEEFAAAVRATVETASKLETARETDANSDDCGLQRVVISRLANASWDVKPVEKYQPPAGERGISNFEEKYRKTNQGLYQLEVRRT